MGEEMNWAVEFQKDGGAAMDRLLERYGPMMAYVVGGILSDPHEAEECLARIRAKLWEKAASFDGERAGLATWLTAVCRNAAYDRLRALERQARRSGELSPDAPDPAPGPEEALLRQEQADRLCLALRRLSETERALFYRKYYYCQSTAQIAAEMGLSERAVEGKLYRLRKQLRRALGGDEA